MVFIWVFLLQVDKKEMREHYMTTERFKVRGQTYRESYPPWTPLQWNVLSSRWTWSAYFQWKCFTTLLESTLCCGSPDCSRWVCMLASWGVCGRVSLQSGEYKIAKLWPVWLCLPVYGLLRVQRPRGGSDEEGLHLEVRTLRNLQRPTTQRNNQHHDLLHLGQYHTCLIKGLHYNDKIKIAIIDGELSIIH